MDQNNSSVPNSPGNVKGFVMSGKAQNVLNRKAIGQMWLDMTRTWEPSDSGECPRFLTDEDRKN